MKNQNFKRRVAFLLTGTMALSALPFNALVSPLNPVAPVVALASDNVRNAILAVLVNEALDPSSDLHDALDTAGITINATTDWDDLIAITAPAVQDAIIDVLDDEMLNTTGALYLAVGATTAVDVTDLASWATLITIIDGLPVTTAPATTPGATTAPATTPGSTTAPATTPGAGATTPAAATPGAGATTPAAATPGAGATTPAAATPGAGATTPAAATPGAGATTPAAATPGAGATTPAAGAGTPGTGTPGTGTPGTGTPGTGTPGTGTPGTGTPGAGTPGAGTPGATTPGATVPSANRPTANLGFGLTGANIHAAQHTAFVPVQWLTDPGSFVSGDSLVGRSSGQTFFNAFHGDVDYVQPARFLNITFNNDWQAYIAHLQNVAVTTAAANNGIAEVNPNITLELHLANAQWHGNLINYIMGQRAAGGTFTNTPAGFVAGANTGANNWTTFGNYTFHSPQIIDPTTNLPIIAGGWRLSWRNNSQVTLEISAAAAISGNVSIPMLARTTSNDANAVVRVTPHLLNDQTVGVPGAWSHPGGNDGTLSTATVAPITVTAHRTDRPHRHTLEFDLRLTEGVLGAFAGRDGSVIELIAPSGFQWTARNTSEFLNAEGRTFHLHGLPVTVSNVQRLQNNSILRLTLTGPALVNNAGVASHIEIQDLHIQATNPDAAPQEVEIIVQNAIARSVAGQAGGTELVQEWFIPANFWAVTSNVTTWENRVNTIWGSTTIPTEWIQPTGWTRDYSVVLEFQSLFPHQPLPNRIVTIGTAGTGTAVASPHNLLPSGQHRVIIGNTADWAVNIETIGDDIPTLVAGRLVAAHTGGAFYPEHRAARVRVEETLTGSWPRYSAITLSLPEGVTVREVTFHNTNYVTSGTLNSQHGGHFNLGNQQTNNENVIINNNVITIGGNVPAAGGRTRIDMDLYLSVSPDFEGDIDIVLGGRGVYGLPGTRYAVIAEAISPITIEAQRQNIRVGYQFVQVGNFSIIENVAGALLQDEEVFISITDHIFSELAVAPGIRAEVTQGNLEISNLTIPTNIGFMMGDAEPHVTFEILRESTQPSTIEFTNVQIRQVMVAPISTVGYDIIVWGPAVAQNVNVPRVHAGNNTAGTGANPLATGAFLNLDQGQHHNFVNPRDLFNVLGFSAPFITIGDGPGAGVEVTNQVVTFSQAGVVTVGGQTVNLDPAYWGSFDVINGVSVLPARMAFSLFFPGSDPNDPVLFAWNNLESRFTIDAPGRNIQFQTHNTEMIVGGLPRTILSGTGDNAFATAPFVHPQTSRMMIPVRAFAEALGLEVSWDNGTSTVTLTPQ